MALERRAELLTEHEDLRRAIRETLDEVITEQKRWWERVAGSLWESVRNHLGLVVSSVVILAVLVRLMIVARGDTTTFLGLLRASNSPSILLPVVLSQLADLAPTLGYLAVLVAAMPSRPPWLQPISSRALLVVVGFLPACFITPWTLLAATLVSSLLLLWAYRHKEGQTLPRWLKRHWGKSRLNANSQRCANHRSCNCGRW